jgi:hypothetical protein
VKWQSLGLGVATFLSTHAVIVAKWSVWFGGGYSGVPHNPWFLNDGDGPIGITAGALCVAAMIAAALWARNRGDCVRHGLNVALGATVAATAILFSIGPGNLFPIVIGFCAIGALVSTMVGSSVVAAFQKR